MRSSCILHSWTLASVSITCINKKKVSIHSPSLSEITNDHVPVTEHVPVRHHCLFCSLVKPNNLFFITCLSVRYFLCDSSHGVLWQPNSLKSEECLLGARGAVTREVSHHVLLQGVSADLHYDSSLLFSSVLCLVTFPAFWFSGGFLCLFIQHDSRPNVHWLSG